MKISFVLLALLCLSTPSLAADQVQTQTRQQIYGSQLMTPQERMEYRSKMRSMKTREEREAYRREHHQQMQERANQRGMQLPDMPPQGGMRRGMGPGGGMGGGMGPGGGMGGGR